MAIIANYIIDATGEVTIVLSTKVVSFPAPDNASPELAAAAAKSDMSLKDVEARIQVSAKHLKLASSVMNRQLTGGFTEAQELHETGKVEIKVEGWDLEALLILLRIIHGRNHQVPKIITLSLFARIGTLVDYYACQETVEIWLHIWKSHLEAQIPTTYNATEIVEWIWVSSFFDMPQVFDCVTLLAIKHGDDLMDSGEFPIKAKIIETINTHREQSIASVLALISRWRHGLRQGVFGCTFEGRSIDLGALEQGLYVANMHQPPTTPYTGWSFYSLVSHVKAFQEPLSQCNPLSYLDHAKCDAIRKIVTEVEAIESEMLGLDLATCK
ncbi:uncharacterized protein BO97DRAFT_412936 [Aspergillus homomorphus CBS 101889]|uniref:BTB domain-containing protein n=1 Tax=Aspergillus homomorphus (strain CBS 101889) TaxID=1450537 RepID=A0A395I280_ASPHC|nr:hypothetical protein BO97DRAFT_412936 [Aspergillus homomorphus CBS 101889]RAL14170.1 hypothetical protein BO97DRAFT_412936 [Aspergillus homomorphus CBS 101889]